MSSLSGRNQTPANRLFRQYLAGLARRLLPASLYARLRRPMALAATLLRQLAGFGVAMLARVFDPRPSEPAAPESDVTESVVSDPVVSESVAPSPALAIHLPQYPQPLVSIVIPVFNQCALTLACLRSIQRYTDGVAYEVIIADDHSSDEIRDIDVLTHGTVKVARSPANVGFLRNVNQAVATACGEYVLILNNDTEVTQGWLEALLAVIQDNPGVGMVGPKLLFEDGTLQEAGGIIWRDGSGWNYGRGGDADDPQFNYVRETDYISGACILLRHALWQRIGGFSEHFKPGYYEDTDLAFTLRKQGYRVLYQPASVVFHFEGKSHGTDVNSGIKRYQQDNAIKFTDKWRAVLEAEHFANAQHVFVARDRSRFRQTVLLVDAFLPELPELADGKPVSDHSSLLLMTLRWLLANGFNVKFFAADGDGRPQRRAALQQMGVQVMADSGLVDDYHDWLTEHNRYIDWLWCFDAGVAERFRAVVGAPGQPRLAFTADSLDSVALQRRYQRGDHAALLPMIARWRQRDQRLLAAASVVLLADPEAVAEAGGWQSAAAVGQLPAQPSTDAAATAVEFDSCMAAFFSAAKEDAWGDE